MSNSIIYALDFDGVICNSAVETAITGWKAAGQIWHDMPDTVPEDLIEKFRQVRPVIETGYEAILAMRLLGLGESCAAIHSHYHEKTQQLLDQAQVSRDDLITLFGNTRDQWIADDEAEWVRMNPLFPNLAERLHRLNKMQPWYVVTTKHERFVKQILTSHGIDLPEARIFGLDRKMGKPEVLLGLQNAHPHQTLWFVEDRLPSLLNVHKHPELAGVELLLALWGYNTDEDKLLAAQMGFKTLKLEDFLL